MGGHIEVVQWVRANGCPWDEKELTTIAAQNGHEAVVRALSRGRRGRQQGG